MTLPHPDPDPRVRAPAIHQVQHGVGGHDSALVPSQMVIRTVGIETVRLTISRVIQLRFLA